MIALKGCCSFTSSAASYEPTACLCRVAYSHPGAQPLVCASPSRPTTPARREKRYGVWATTAWSALAELVKALAGGLAAAGLQRGQHIVVIGDNRPRLYASMLAAQALGAIPVPLYLALIHILVPKKPY